MNSGPSRQRREAGFRGKVTGTLTAVSPWSMIRKSAKRFSEKIMLKQ